MNNFNLNDEVSLVNTTKEKALTLNQSGSSLRTRISPKLLNDIDNTTSIASPERSQNMREMDNFDFIIHVALDRKLLTKKERANDVKEEEIFHPKQNIDRVIK